MKIFLDNEQQEFHKIVSIVSSYNKDIFDDVDTVIDAFLAYGYDLKTIQRGFLEKLVDWELIEPFNDYDNGDYIDNKESYDYDTDEDIRE